MTYSRRPLSSAALWRQAARTGLIMGGVAVFLALAGLVAVFSGQEIIAGVFSLGTLVLVASSLIAGQMAGQKAAGEPLARRLGLAGLAGLVTHGCLALLVLLGNAVNLRTVFVNATADLYDLLLFGRTLPVGIVLLLASGAALGVLALLFALLPARWRSPVQTGLLVVFLLGVLHEIARVLLTSLGVPAGILNLFFTRNALTLAGALLVFAVTIGLSVALPPLRLSAAQRPASPSRQRATRAIILAVVGVALLFVPRLVQLYWTDVLDNVGLFLLMGLGLNIVVGFAGLLDLGYVAFFALGAYTVGLLTSPASSLGIGLSFWVAWPFALLVSALAGILLGIPVLRMRGDYLAIVTLGFGEIIRVLATSDLLKPIIGGAQGILNIPKPTLFGIRLGSAMELYFLLLLSCIVVGFVAWRLSDSRIGRAWMAIREDEDVAEAMGIHLVKHKLMAFAIGAAFAGMSGAINATKLGSIFPHSFNLLISVNVLSLIIVGGIGSIPGVIVGAFILVGLPEVLREFSDYRLMLYGALLVAMMLRKPAGFWPAEVRRRELAATEVPTTATPQEGEA